MLLLTYLLYRYARSARPRSYVLDITTFVLAVSLVSAFSFGLLPFGSFFFLPYPPFFPIFLIFFLASILALSFMFLSFPFFLWHYEVFDQYGSTGQQYRAIRFLTIDITSAPDTYEFITTFSLFLFINILGAFLGHWIGKKHRVECGDGWKILCAFAGVVCVGASFIIGRALHERAGVAILGLGIILLETIFLSWLIENDFLSWLARARVATFMVLGGITVFLAGRQINHVLLILGGQMLVLFGVVIYFVKLTIAHVRARNRERED